MIAKGYAPSRDQDFPTRGKMKVADSFQNASKKVAEEFQIIAFNPPEIMKIERGFYRRSPY